MKKNSITYIGKIENFPLQVTDLKNILGYKFKHLEFSDDFQPLIENLTLASPALILLEVSNIDDHFLSFLLLLKSHSKIKKIKIIAIFPDKDCLTNYSDIYSFGVDYAFIANEERERILSDLDNILNPAESEPIQFAKAESLYIPARVTFPSKLSHLSDQYLYVETSLKLIVGEVIEANLRLSDQLTLKFFKIEEVNNFVPRSYFNKTAKIKILFDKSPDIKSEIVGKLTTQKEFSAYLLENFKSTFTRNDPALILDRRTETMVSLIDELNVNNRFIKISNNYPSIEEIIPTFSPEIICFQMEEEGADMEEDEKLLVNGPHTFNIMLQKVRSIPNYNPFILVFNDRSRSKAYRKAHNYDKIIVNRKSFELYYLSMLIDEYQSHHPIDNKTFYLRPPEKNTIVEISGDIIITSISENIVTFLYQHELAPYSTFKIANPLNIFVTTIPINLNLETKVSYHHYSGFISNTSEEDKMELRKLVNLLIKLEIASGETFELKSVEELREDTIKIKASELAELRKIQQVNIEQENDQEEGEEES